MYIMDSYNITELASAIVIVIGAIGSCCLIIEKSRCKKLKCWCVDIERDVIKQKETENPENNFRQEINKN